MLSQHIEQLKNFKAPSILDGANKIYFLEVLEKPNLVKIGDTSRGENTDIRNNETIKNPSLHKTKPVTWIVAEKFDGSEFRDKAFHKFLEKKKYVRELNDDGNKSEWFYITLEQALYEFSEFTKKPVFKTVELRTVQHYGLDLLAEATDAGYTKINFGSCMRSGKTIISLTHAKRNNCMPVYIGKNLTSQSSAKVDNDEYGIVEHMATVSIHGQDEDTDGELTKKAKAKIADIDAKNTLNQNIILYIDECDDSSHTEKSRKIIKQVAKHYYEKGMLFQVIPMTGTRKERGLTILNELDFMPGKNKDLAIEYWEMQILQPEDTVKRNFITISYFQEYAEGLVNISEALKNHDEGHESIATFVKAFLRKGGSKYGAVKTDVYKAPHYFFKFCVGGKSNDGYKERMEALVDTFNDELSIIGKKEYLFQPIWGGVTKSAEAQDFCKKVIEKNPGKIVVFVSFGMATTSFSVSSIGTSVVFSDNALGADDVQGLHRAATWHKGKEWCNMVHVTTCEGTDLMLNDVYEAELPDGGPKEKQPIFKEILNYNSLIHVDIRGADGKFFKRTYQDPQIILDERAAKRTQTNMMVQTVLGSLRENASKLRPETVAKLLSIDPKSGKIKMPKKSKTEKGSDYDPHNAKGDKEPKKKAPGMTPSKMESIVRSFVTGVQMVPAVSKLKKIDMEDFAFWDEINVDEELYSMVCEDLPEFKDDLDHIFRLCDDASNLKPYLQKIT